jgi:hypothetical protein
MDAMKCKGTLAILLLLGAGGCLSNDADTSAPARSLSTHVQNEPWRGAGSTGQVLTSEHYRIYTTAKRQIIPALFPGFMEASLRNYWTLTGLAESPDIERMPMYMMGTREEWALLTKEIIPARQDAYLSIEAGGYCYKGICVFWDLGGTGTFSVAAHEGMHQFLYHRLENPLPLWLEEGLCVSAEGHRIEGRHVRFTPKDNAFRFSALRNAILQDRWMPIRRILPLDGGDVSVKGTDTAVSYYAQLWALVQFLRSRPDYRQGIEQLIADADAGRFDRTLDVPVRTRRALRDFGRRSRRYNQILAEPLFREYITEDFETFDREFLAYARKIADLD